MKPKPKEAITPEKKEEEIIEVEEMSEDPVVIKGAKVNLLGMSAQYLNEYSIIYNSLILNIFRSQPCNLFV